MRRRLAALCLAGLALAAGGAPGALAMKKERPALRRSTELPRPIDGDIPVRGELEAARRAGTRAAYDLFLARHGDHRFAVTARRERAALPAGKGAD